jgi:hypothetical protein
MATSIKFEGINRHFQTPPENPEEDGPFGPAPMWGFSNGVVTFTRWRLSPDELDEGLWTGEVWLAVRCGQRPMQPHWLGSLGWIKQACSDFGGLWRVREINQPKPKQLPPPRAGEGLEPA